MGGKSIISSSYLEDIGDAIRYKKGTSETYYPSQMGDAIRSIEGIVPTGSIEISENDTYDVTEYASAVVDVQPDLRPLAINENGEYQPDGFDGYSSVTVDVEPVLETLSATENGLYLPETGVDGFDRVNVNVSVPSGSIEITENGTYNVASKETAVVNVVSESPWTDYDDVSINLPVEYQRVEYIESSGMQFIELPIGFYPTDFINAKMSIDLSMGADKFMVSPSRWNDDNNRFGLCGVNRNKRYVVTYGNLGTNTIFGVDCDNDGQTHMFSYDQKLFISPDLYLAESMRNATFGAETANLKLFYGYNANTIGKINYYIHKKVDGRKLALFACYRKLDGVIGMYDIENDVFYTNDGTGTFAKGADVSST